MNDDERLLPYALEAERAVLGAILIEQTCLYAASVIVATEDFYLAAHRIIFISLQNLRSRECGIDLVTVKNELQRSNRLEECGGAAYLMALTDGLPKATNVQYYAGIVREKAKLRKLIEICGATSTKCFQAEDSSIEIIAEHQAEVRKLNTQGGKGFYTGVDSINDCYNYIKARNDDKRKVTGIATGIIALDELTTGFQAGDLVVISAKTGFGKTAFALNAAAHAMIYYGKRVIIFSLEMSREQLCTRIISSYSEVDSYQLRTGYIRNVDWDSITDAAKRLADCKFWVHDQSITFGDLDSRTRQVAEESGVDLIVVDYLQLVTLGGKRKIENRTQEVTEVSRGLKAIATDLGIPVIALSQENEQGETRESRAIEHDASLFISIEMEKEELKTLDNVPVKIQIRKNRNGSLGTIDAIFRKRITKFC